MLILHTQYPIPHSPLRSDFCPKFAIKLANNEVVVVVFWDIYNIFNSTFQPVAVIFWDICDICKSTSQVVAVESQYPIPHSPLRSDFCPKFAIKLANNEVVVVVFWDIYNIFNSTFQPVAVIFWDICDICKSTSQVVVVGSWDIRW